MYLHNALITFTLTSPTPHIPIFPLPQTLCFFKKLTHQDNQCCHYKNRCRGPSVTAWSLYQ